MPWSILTGSWIHLQHLINGVTIGQKNPFENGSRQEYNINIAGGTENTQAYASLGYLSDEGYVVGSEFERISARVKVDRKLASM